MTKKELYKHKEYIMEFKKTKELFSRSMSDTRKTINRSEKIIPEEILREIEEKGVTCERLETLNVPVFYYMTQITIHGQFPEIMRTQAATGYKSIFQNKNMSIGVKYIAIDIKKKKTIFRLINQYKNFPNSSGSWRFIINSSRCYMKKAIRVRSAEEYQKELNEVKNELSGLLENGDKNNKQTNMKFKSNLFIGGINIFLGVDAYGGVYLIADINISSIPEKNIDRFLELFLKDNIKNIREIARKNNEIRETKLKREREEFDRRFNQRIEKTKKMKKEFSDFMESNGFVFKKGIKNRDGLVFIVHKLNDGLDRHLPRITKMVKIKDEQKLIGLSNKGKSMEDILSNKFYEFKENPNNYNELTHERYKTRGKYAYVNGWIKPEWEISETPKKQTVSKPKKQTISDGKLKIIDYSEYSIALIGDTKQYKDRIKELGGKFNFRLSCGPGWIFSNKLKQNVEKFVNQINGSN